MNPATGRPLPRRVPLRRERAPPAPRPGARTDQLPFGRHLGWSLGEVARVDPGYLEWLEDRAEGAPYRAEIDELLRRLRRRQAAPPASPRRGLWRRS